MLHTLGSPLLFVLLQRFATVLKKLTETSYLEFVSIMIFSFLNGLKNKHEKFLFISKYKYFILM